MIFWRNILKRRKNKFKLLCENLVRLLKLYLTPNTKLTGRQRLTKLRIETFLSYILLLVLIILALQSAFIYYKVHRSIQIESVTFARTGLTSLSCYSNYRGTILCCADDPYLNT